MILDDLAEYAALRVAEDKKQLSFNELRNAAEVLTLLEKTTLPGKAFRFERRLSGQELSYICEVKKASPSKGVIAEDFPYIEIAEDYERAGADCVSCLTEPKWFLGSDAIFSEIRQRIDLPMIRKDFTVDPYQIYQAKLMGADAVLLICTLLETERLKEYLDITRSLGMTALVETHSEEEIESALKAGGKVVGVNNRNLKNFTVDFENAKRLRKLIPDECIFVAESGVKNAEDIAALAQIGADAVLVGEALMRAGDKGEMLKCFREAERKL